MKKTSAAGGKRRKKAAGPAAVRHPAAFYSLHALLDTLRAFQTYEEQLCSLLHEIGRTGELDAALRKDLRTMLREMPSEQYRRELVTLEQALIAKPQHPTRATPTRRAKRIPEASASRLRKPAVAKKTTSAAAKPKRSASRRKATARARSSPSRR